jgi:cell division transport system permease protein
MLSTFFYLLEEALKNLKENLFTASLASLVIGVSLSIFALFTVFFVNLDSRVEKWAERTHLIAYLEEPPTEEAAWIKKRIERIAGVKEARYVSKEEAFEAIKEELREYSSLLEGVGGGSLPASFEITLSLEHVNAGGLGSVMEKLEEIESVERMESGGQWAERFSSLLGFTKVIAFFAGIFLLAATVFIVSNTIRLAIYARREEIEVMEYLGATEGFVKLPFFIESGITGAAGGVISFAIVSVVRYAIELHVPPYLAFVVSSPVKPAVFAALLILAGVFTATIGCLASATRILKT